MTKKAEHEPYPHPKRFNKIMDRLVYLIVIVGPLMTIPQVTKIWFLKNAAGVSIPTLTVGSKSSITSCEKRDFIAIVVTEFSNMFQEL